PTCSITGTNAVCASSTGNNFSGPAGMTNYSWSISGNGTISGSSTSQNVSVNATASAGTFTLTLTITDSNGCSSTCNWSVTVNAKPTANVSGSTSICPGGSATLSVALTGAAPWAILWADGFTQSAIASSPVTRTVMPSSTTTYSVSSVSDANGCTNNGGTSATITVNSPPAITADPVSRTNCVGTVAT